MALPPLALYIHIPWCLSKCPYCDFNSHPLHGSIPETAYVECLLRDLEQETTDLASPRPLTSVFIGGGTPSLFSGTAIARLLQGVRDLVELPVDAEITLEANPGTTAAARLAAYRQAGVNRLSIGVQSLSARHLERIARIHGPADVRSAVAQARRAGFKNLNLDLMYGLPEQSLAQAYRDLEATLALEPEHISYYQLSMEPNTAFHRAPPPVPDEDLIADMQLQGATMLAARGFESYEVSAYAPVEYRCWHNLNYWRFGDYLGIGAGAHGKLTFPARQRIERRWKLRDPAAYLDPANRDRLVSGKQVLSEADLILEFALNALRLSEGFDAPLFERHTGLSFARIADRVGKARSVGLLAPEQEDHRVRPTELGRRFLNDLLQYFT
ncbi:radical SAM family heme chaperone HemW [Candidatus Thiosymbion oneisti]|uniref:radical SAM family heme chaperone HemW n=1 Tax=Candidatus Thiosymbion oneisti TaxID=589554 RepID=UPI000AF9CFE8|nr:radical SAM family heme chaperone HemW [Candidatus Thiosymbion oneisti]